MSDKILSLLSRSKNFISLRKDKNDSFFVVDKKSFISFLRRFEHESKGKFSCEIYSDLYMVKEDNSRTPVAFSRRVGLDEEGKQKMIYCVHVSKI